MVRKLTSEIVAAMRIERRRGMSYPAMAAMAGVNPGTVRAACLGYNWPFAPAAPIDDAENERLKDRIGNGARARRFTDEQVREIRRRKRAGELQPVLAREYGVSQPAISLLVRGLTYAHVVDGEGG